MTRPRWVLTVNSLVPNSAPICLFSNPEATSFSTSFSRGVSVVVARAELGHLRALAPGDTVLRNRLLNRIQKFLTAERFGEEFNRPGLHGAHGHGNIRVAGNENDRDLNVGFGQFALEFETADVRQPHIQHQAGGRVRTFAARNSRVDPKVSTRKPTDAISRFTASRTDASSSTTNTIGSAAFMMRFPFGRQVN